MNKRNKNIIFSLFILCALAVTFLLLKNNSSGIDSNMSDTAQLLLAANIKAVEPRKEPRDFTLEILDDENTSLSSHKGKLVLLNFWATWCPPCVREMPSMNNLYNQYKNKGFEILAVNLREDSNTVRQFIQDNDYSFPVLLDSDGNVGSVYGVEMIPTSYLIDREGKIAGMIIGSIYWDTLQVMAAVESLLQ
ncbi:MAG: TlpA family protein disulfide reductase [Treponema sp.]|nr:TlpA family protein disulfide reductase [Treponema sp.]MCL2271867.1 TlpA family protein disulfide reductase [Treponema sp.]